MNDVIRGLVTSNKIETTDDDIVKVIIDVTNDDFLTVIFGSDFKKARPLVCKIDGDPEGASWPAQDWPCDTSDGSLNWFAQPSLYDPTENGQYRAKRNFANRVFCVMLDDIGTKVPFERIERCPPTWLIETSPGNYQLGYLFAEPIDGQQADALKVALIEAGLCDSGASGGAARWMRLPVGINGKQKYGVPSFQCRLCEWHPDRRYTLEEINVLLELSPLQENSRTGVSTTAEDDV